MLFDSNTRFVAYSRTKEKVYFEKEFSTLHFDNSEIAIPKQASGRESFALPAAAIAKAVTLGYSFLQDQLQKRLEKFVYTYHQRATNLQAGSYLLPQITFSNFIFPPGKKHEALRIRLVPFVLPGTGTFTYRLEELILGFSKAKTSTRSDVFDYTLQLTLYFLQNGETIERSLPPLTVRSVGFGENQLGEQGLHTSIIPRRDDALLIEAALTVVESNPAHVNTAKILELLGDHKEKWTEQITALLTHLLPAD